MNRFITFTTIGTLYLLPIMDKDEIWVVIENDFNNKKTILENVYVGLHHGERKVVDANELSERKPLGSIPINGTIVVENGRQFIKPPKQKTRTYMGK